MELACTKRDKTGKKVKSLRKGLELPCVVFGNEIESTSITCGLREFEKLFKKAGETSLVDLKLGQHSYKVLVNDVQHSPVTSKIIHVSFYKPNLKEKTEVNVPVEVTGEDKNILIKSGTALLLTLMHEVTVKALPSDLPERFLVDVSQLQSVGEGITIEQLEYDKTKVEIVDTEPDEFVVKLDSPQMQEEEPAPVTEEEAIAQMEATAESEEKEEGTEEEEK